MTAAYAFKVIVCREWQLSRSEAKESASAAVHTKMMCTSSYHKIPKGEVRGADHGWNKSGSETRQAKRHQMDQRQTVKIKHEATNQGNAEQRDEDTVKR